MNVKIDSIKVLTDEFDKHNIIVHVRLAWDDEWSGHGLIDIRQDRMGTFINSENMGREFVKKVLCSLVDEAEMEDEG